MNISRFARYLYALNLGVLSFLFIIPSLEALLLHQHVTLASRFPSAILGLAYLCGFLTIAFLEQLKDRRALVPLAVAAAVSVLMLALGALLSQAISDASWDGLAYHQPAIYELRAGWNPVLDLKDAGLFGNFILANHYPKASWFCSATLFGVFGNIQAAKLTFFLAPTVFLSLILLFKNAGLSPILRAAVALVLVLNPVAICQAWQFYVDGVLYYILVLMVVAAIQYAKDRHTLDLVLMFLAALFAANVKFTGIIYAGIIFTWLVMDMWLAPGGARRHYHLVLGGALGWVIGLLLTGWSPYFQHILKWQHPFYPIYGEGRMDIVGFMMPKPFRGHSWLWRLWHAHAEFDLGSVSVVDVLKQLGLAGGGGMGSNSYDTIVLGFGRVFIFAVFLALAASAFHLSRNFSKRVLLGLVTFCVFVFLNPAAWWPRYSPCLWALPVVLCMPTLLLGRRLLDRSLVMAALFLVGMTSYIYCGQSWWEQRDKGARENEEVADLMRQIPKGAPVEVATADFATYIYRLRREGYPLQWVGPKDLHCPAPTLRKTLRFCPPRVGQP
jgi:hypothetical protein